MNKEEYIRILDEQIDFINKHPEMERNLIMYLFMGVVKGGQI